MAYSELVTTGRLTRQELGWLLAQEARGAAKILRQDVSMLSQPPPADLGIVVPQPEIRVTSTLDALEDSIRMLTELETGPGSASKGARRGRIDLAALLWDIAPTATISIEPGAGTEVFGEEGDLRRILHVLLSNSTGDGQEIASSPIRIRREADWIRIGVDLGPDVSASTVLERRWLSRMATQMGGKLELESSAMAILLPADASNDQSEVADLRKELEQAQQLGEAYARELAAAFAAGQDPEIAVVAERPDIGARRFELLVGFASALHRSLAPVFRSLRGDSESHDSRSPGDSLTAHVSIGAEIVSELGRVAACPPDEPTEVVDLARVLRDIASEAEGRASRHGVTLEVAASAPLGAKTRPKALALLVRSLLEHAIDATPRGGTVHAVLESEGGGTLTITDGGTAVPAAARADLLEHRVDPASLGRPPGASLLVANAVAPCVGATVRLLESSSKSSVTEVRFRGL